MQLNPYPGPYLRQKCSPFAPRRQVFGARGVEASDAKWIPK